MKKIHIYTQYYYPVANACSNRVEKYVKAFYKNYDITVVTWMPNYPSGIKSKQYKWKLLKKEVGNYDEKIFRTYELAVKNSWSFLRTLNYVSFLISSFIFGIFSKKPDKIIVTSPPLFTAISVLGIYKIRKIPYVLEIRDLWPDSVVALGYMSEKSLSFKVFSYLEKSLYRNAESIIWVTQWVCDAIIEKWIDVNKVKLQYNLSDEIQEKDVWDNPYIQYKDLIKWRKVSLFAGNMNEAYDFNEASEYISSHDDVFFIFIGEGSMKESFVNMTEWCDNILFLDRMPAAEVQTYIYYSDICFIPLKNEPFYNLTFPVKWIEWIVNNKEVIFLGSLQWEFAKFLKKYNDWEVGKELFLIWGFSKNIKKVIDYESK